MSGWLMFKGWSFRAKILVLLFFASTTPAAVATIITFYSSRTLLYEDAEQLLVARVEGLAKELDAFHQPYMNSASRMAKSPSMRGVVEPDGTNREQHESNLVEIFQTFAASDPDVWTIALLNPTGKVVVSNEPLLNGKAFGSQSYIENSLNAHTPVSDVFVISVGGRQVPLIAYTSPVLVEEKLMGFAVLFVRARAFWDAVRAGNGAAGDGSYALVLDHYGMRVAHSFRDDHVFHPAGSLAPEVAEQMLRTKRFGEDTQHIIADVVAAPQLLERATPNHLTTKEGAFTVVGAANQQRNLSVARRLRTVDWTLFFMVPEVSIATQVQTLVTRTSFASLFILVALVVGVLFGRQILRPVLQLSQAAARIEEGDLQARVTLQTNDELGHLGRRFNAMAQAIQDARGGLEARVQERTVDLERANDELKAQREELLAQREELRAQQSELIEKNNEVERANQLKSEFLANMSHELRTPLNSIIGFSDLVIDGAQGTLSSKHLGYLDDVLRSGRHLLNLINDILDLSKIEAGYSILQPAAVNPRDAILDVTASLLATAAQKALSIKTDVNTQQHVHADPSKLQQVLLNLLVNAVKFSPDGASVEIGAHDAHEGFVRFYVRDYGQGIEPSLLPRLFQPFVQGESALVKKHQGTGLGLAISKRLVEQHGGVIDVEPLEPGVRFSFTMPIAQPNDRMATSNSAHALEALGSILLIDDGKQSGPAYCDLLSRAGYTPVLLDNGAHAVGLALTISPAAIVLNPLTNSPDGLSLLHQFKSDVGTQHIPLVLTAAPDARTFVPKPIDRDHLLRDLRVALVDSLRKQSARVLAIDDDPRVGMLLTDIMEPHGYKVVVANSGRHGLELAASEEFDLAIVDLMMPELSGFDVINELTQAPRTHDMPVVVLTAKDLTLEESTWLKERARAVAEKGSINKNDLLAAVRRAIRQNHAMPLPPEVGLATVLVVDDHDLNRELASSLLERRGYRVLLADNGDSGIAMALQENPAVVLLDLAMPGKDGFSVAKELRADPRTRHIPLVAVTALAMRGDEEKALAEGFDGYLTKPLDKLLLEQTVARFVALRKEEVV